MRAQTRDELMMTLDYDEYKTSRAEELGKEFPPQCGFLTMNGILFIVGVAVKEEMDDEDGVMVSLIDPAKDYYKAMDNL